MLQTPTKSPNIHKLGGGGDTLNHSQVTQHPQMGGDTSNPKIPILMTRQKLSTLQGDEILQTPTSGDRQPKAKVHWNFNLLDHKFKPIKPKKGSTLISQERIEDVLNSILESQERINEELAQISWIANSTLQVSLANQFMLSTLCKDNSPKPKEIPHFQFLKKRVKDFNKLSFRLSSPINKNMSMDSIPKEVVPYHINNGVFQNYTWLWAKPWRNYMLRDYWTIGSHANTTSRA